MWGEKANEIDNGEKPKLTSAKDEDRKEDELELTRDKDERENYDVDILKVDDWNMEGEAEEAAGRKHIEEDEESKDELEETEDVDNMNKEDGSKPTVDD